MRADMDIADVAIYQANLHTLGEQYLLDNLCRRVQAAFEARIGWILQDGSIGGVVNHLYNQCGNEADVPRAELVQLFVRNPDVLKQSEGHVANMLLEIPEFTSDIIRVLAQKNEDLDEYQFCLLGNPCSWCQNTRTRVLRKQVGTCKNTWIRLPK